MTFPLTVAAFQDLVTTSLDEDAIQLLLDAAEEAVIGRAGPTVDEYAATSRTERFRPSGGSLMLSERALSIVAINEYADSATPIELEEDDFQLSASGRMVRRRIGGTNSSPAWRGAVEVEYVPDSDTARRAAAQLNLVKLEIAFTPGLASQVVGAWTETYTNVGTLPYDQQREAILAALVDEPLVML